MAKVWMSFDEWAEMNDSWDGRSTEELNRPMSTKRESEALESQYQGGSTKRKK